MTKDEAIKEKKQLNIKSVSPALSTRSNDRKLRKKAEVLHPSYLFYWCMTAVCSINLNNLNVLSAVLVFIHFICAPSNQSNFKCSILEI